MTIYRVATVVTVLAVLCATGTGAQDTAIAVMAHARALQSGRGTPFES